MGNKQKLIVLLFQNPIRRPLPYQLPKPTSKVNCQSQLPESTIDSKQGSSAFHPPPLKKNQIRQIHRSAGIESAGSIRASVKTRALIQSRNYASQIFIKQNNWARLDSREILDESWRAGFFIRFQINCQSQLLIRFEIPIRPQRCLGEMSTILTFPTSISLSLSLYPSLSISLSLTLSVHLSISLSLSFLPTHQCRLSSNRGKVKK